MNEFKYRGRYEWFYILMIVTLESAKPLLHKLGFTYPISKPHQKYLRNLALKVVKSSDIEEQEQLEALFLEISATCGESLAASVYDWGTNTVEFYKENEWYSMLSLWEMFFAELIFDGTREVHDILLKLNPEKHKELIYLAYHVSIQIRKGIQELRALAPKLQQELDGLEVSVEEYTDKNAISGWISGNMQMKDAIAFWRIMGQTFSSEELEIIREWGQAAYSNSLNLTEEVKIVYIKGINVYVE